MNLHGNSFTRITLASLSWKFSVPFSENLILPLTCSPKSKSSCKSENFLLDWDYQEYIVITFAVAVSHQDFTPQEKKKRQKKFWWIVANQGNKQSIRETAAQKQQRQDEGSNSSSSDNVYIVCSAGCVESGPEWGGKCWMVKLEFLRQPPTAHPIASCTEMKSRKCPWIPGNPFYRQ